MCCPRNQTLQGAHLSTQYQPSVKVYTHVYTYIGKFPWIDTLEVQEVVLGVNLVELEVQFYHQTRVGMNVAAVITHTHRRKLSLVSVSPLGIDNYAQSFTYNSIL
jgi:hypothetical protein